MNLAAKTQLFLPIKVEGTMYFIQTVKKPLNPTTTSNY